MEDRRARPPTGPRPPPHPTNSRRTRLRWTSPSNGAARHRPHRRPAATLTHCGNTRPLLSAPRPTSSIRQLPHPTCRSAPPLSTCPIRPPYSSLALASVAAAATSLSGSIITIGGCRAATATHLRSCHGSQAEKSSSFLSNGLSPSPPSTTNLHHLNNLYHVAPTAANLPSAAVTSATSGAEADSTTATTGGVHKAGGRVSGVPFLSVAPVTGQDEDGGG